MMERLWLFQSNPFLRATNGNYEKMLIITEFSYGALLGDVTKAALLNFYEPFNTDYITAYNAWKTGGGSQKSATASLKSLLKGLTVAVNDWDFEVQQVHRKGTPEYLGIFPNGHKPFLQGKQATRMAAVGSLINALEGIPALATLKAAVLEYYTELTNADNIQKGKLSQTDTLSGIVEAKRIAACQALYHVLGSLMALYYINTAPIKNYFKLELIRTQVQDYFTGHTTPGTRYTIVERTLEPTAEIMLKNTGTVPLTFYLAAVKDGPLPPEVVGITVAPGEETHVPASSLGDPLANKFLTVYNASGIADGVWEVEVD